MAGSISREMSLESVSKGNISLDGLPKKMKKKREFYEEMMERERRDRHVIVTKTYCRAKKQYLDLQKQLKQTVRISNKELTEPLWYQELSIKQTNILDRFGKFLKEDYDLGTSKESRRALKALGVRTFIPHTVARDALHDSKLYPEPFLTAIKDYVIQKFDILDDRPNYRKNKKYSPEERILMSSILYLSYPNLIKKLDYCLKEPVPEKKLTYMKLSKCKTSKYLSPYLEPIPQPEQSWLETEKMNWHNRNVKTLKIRENLKTKKLERLRGMELDIERKTEFKMRITYPKHPLEKMFYKPPLMKEFKNDNVQQKKMNNHRTTSTAMAETSDGSAIVTNEATSVVNDEEWSTSEKLDSHSLIRLIPSRASDHPSKAVRMDLTPLSSPNASADEHQPVDDSGVREEEKPYGWLKSGSTRSNVSIESTDDESTVDNGGPAANVNLMLVTTDMTALPDGSNSDSVQLDCSAVENEEETTTPSVDGVENKENGNNDTVFANSDRMDEKEAMVWREFRIFEERNAKGGGAYFDDRDPKTPTKVCDQKSPAKDSDPKKPSQDRNPGTPSHERTRHLWFDRPTTESMVTLPRTPPPSEVDGSDFQRLQTEKRPRNESLPGNQPHQVDLSRNTVIEAGTSRHSKNGEPSTQPPRRGDDGVSPADQHIVTNLTNEDNSVNLDQILVELNKLPVWKQLKAVLQFLSILGDPVAGYPQLIELNQLRRWYEIRINKNRHMTAKLKKDLLNKSFYEWNSAKPTLKSLTIPMNPIKVKNGVKKITWNQTNSVKRTIKKTRNEYTTKLKHLAINDARQLYPTMHNEYYNSRLSKHFKQTFYDYLPAKEDECHFDAPPTVKVIKKDPK